MNIQNLHGIRQEIWSTQPVYRNLNALQNLENELAQQQQRDSCVVRAMQDDGETNGKFIPEQLENGERVPSTIFVNTALLTNDEPYEAVETLCHESRHAYQNEIVQHPEKAQANEPIEDWKVNISKEGYLTGKQYGYDVYRWQPIEKDANEFTRQETDRIYQTELQDTRYENYRVGQEAQLKGEIEQAKNNPRLRENYAENARQLSYQEYENGQAFNQQKTETSEPSTGESQERDYSYGYGL